MRAISILAAAGVMALAASASAALLETWTFDTGNSDPTWTTDYKLNTVTGGMMDAGYYAVTDNPVSVHSLWTSMPPQSGDRLLAYNGTTSTNVQRVWQANVSGAAGGNYTFGFFLANVYSSNPAQLDVYVDPYGTSTPTNKVTTASISVTDTGTWHYESVAFLAPSDIFTVSILNGNSLGDGNDFALDTIQVANSVPEPTCLGLIATAGGLLIARRRK